MIQSITNNLNTLVRIHIDCFTYEQLWYNSININKILEFDHEIPERK